MKNTVIILTCSFLLASCLRPSDPEAGVSRMTDGQQNVPTAKVISTDIGTGTIAPGSQFER